MKYHIINTNDEGRKIKILRSSNLEDVHSALLDSVDYTDEGLVAITYIIYYEGTKILQEDFTQSSNNKTYLIVPKLKPYKHLKEKATLMTLPVTQYQNDIAVLQAIMTPETWSYYWTEYCVKRFKASPTKCYNEARYLLIQFEQNGKNKFTINDIDCIYNKVSSESKRYLDCMFTDEGKNIILTMTNSEMFLLFVRGKTHKAPVQSAIENAKPEMVFAYSLFKESFFNASIGLREGILILDYLLNKESTKTITEVKDLFNLN